MTTTTNDVRLPVLTPGVWFQGLFSGSVIAALFWGWQHRHDDLLSAEEGLGYMLGIIGGSLMLALLLYPLRKRLRFMQRWLPVAWWFRLHMIFGVLGPVLILFHANFGLGSLNSQVALFCMLLVAGSGLVGRYIYRRIHMGLYGHRASFNELGMQLDQILAAIPEEARRVQFAQSYEHLRQALIPRLGAHGKLFKVLFAVPRATLWRWKMLWTTFRHRRELDAPTRREIRRTTRKLAQLTIKLAQLDLFSRLFHWWHIVHLPFFIMMIITALVHVYVVHTY
ncbi:MAG: transcriptional regulator [Gammaproteobacteria bacterium]|nr:MAG: transcriptional regulator [Gammaproteobacteria bacterium]